MLEKSFDTGETTINYAEGPAAGPPLVLLHGLTGWWHSMQLLTTRLSPKWHVYACDLRGHGKSGRMADRYRLTDYAQDIAAFLRATVPEPAVLLGHSLGALTALATAPLAPESAHALVLLDPPLFNRDGGIEAVPETKGWFSWVYETVRSARSYEDVLARCRALVPEADEASLKKMANQIHGVAPDTVNIALRDELLDGFDLEHALGHIACPTLLLYGEWARGATVRDEDADFVRAHLPHAVVIKLHDAGHQLHEEETATVLHHMKTFLEANVVVSEARA